MKHNKIDELSEIEMITDNPETLKRLASALFRTYLIDDEEHKMIRRRIEMTKKK